MELRMPIAVISSNARLVIERPNFLDPEEPTFVMALCVAEGCKRPANGFRDKDAPVCFEHGAPRMK